ncbi:MAG: DUF4907 domain-containing protein [Bacteroidales bacterium]
MTEFIFTGPTMSFRWGWIFIFLWGYGGCQPMGNRPLPKNDKTTDSLAIQVYRVDKKGWGYRILKKDKPFINQPFIPSIGRKISFSDSLQASRIAQLVVKKLRNNIIPPAISQQELDSMGVIPSESALTDKP